MKVKVLLLCVFVCHFVFGQTPEELNALGQQASLQEDYVTAVQLFTKSAEYNNADAQYSLGVCYYNGLGVEQSIPLAVEYYQKSAEQGNATSQYNLGLCYQNGNGVSKDIDEAVKWFSKAAAQGHENAKKALDRLTK